MTTPETHAPNPGVRWSDDFVVLRAKEPFSKLSDALLNGTSRFIVVVWNKRRQCAFLRSELKSLQAVEEALANPPKAQSIADVLQLPEAHTSMLIQSEEEAVTWKSGPPWISRYVLVSKNGAAQRIGVSDRGRATARSKPPTRLSREAPSLESAAPIVDEGTEVTRYPSILTDKAPRPGRPIVITVDLLLRNTDSKTVSTGVTIRDLPGDWTELSVDVEVQAAGVSFENPKGAIRVHRNTESVPCTFNGTVDADVKPGQSMFILATFSYASRFCGMAKRDVAAEAGEAGTQPGTAAVMGGVQLHPAAVAPQLTAKIFNVGAPGKLFWSLSLANGLDIPDRPETLSGPLDLGSETDAFAKALYAQFGELRPGEHMEAFIGVGEKIWQKTPQCFRETYWAMRRALGPEFSIQFVTDDPHIPWELMRPYLEKPKEKADILMLTHPVGRWIAPLEGKFRQGLTPGKIVTIAPQYPRISDELKRAQEEADLLIQSYGAVRVEGKRKPVQTFLEKGIEQGAVAIVHFAGHGEFRSDLAGASSIKLEDGSLTADQVSRQEVMLGEINGPLVIFNACEVGATGSVLGTVGGWAEAFLRREFRGFIAPLWPVDDIDASTIMGELFAAVIRDHTTVGEAMRDIRRRHGSASPTYFAYLFYGDVMARSS